MVPERRQIGFLKVVNVGMSCAIDELRQLTRLVLPAVVCVLEACVHTSSLIHVKHIFLLVMLTAPSVLYNIYTLPIYPWVPTAPVGDH